jgi:hypothetical protein
VNYSEAPLKIPEGAKLGLESPGAPDTVRWCTGQSGAPHQGYLRLSLALFVEPVSCALPSVIPCARPLAPV